MMQKTIPKAPGVYLFKNKHQRVIYIGKAKSLKDRVKSYFKNYSKDWKVDALLDEHAEIDFIITKNETEALLLEAQLISEYKPKFNVLLKSGQPFLYILFTPLQADLKKIKTPQMKLVRNKKEKGTYFGPFLHKSQARGVYNFLQSTFGLNVCNKKIENGCLDYHLGNCAGNCKSLFDIEDYKFRLQLAMDVLKNNHRSFLKKLKSKITEHNNNLAFEKARNLAQYINQFDIIFDTIKTRYSERKFFNDIFVITTPSQLSPDNHKINEQLQEFLKLQKPVRSIDCFDISHFQSSYIAGSCVRFTNGIPDKNNFRRFKIKTLEQQDDYAALQEIVSRRYRDTTEIPDIVLIDGGKGQLNAVKKIIPQATVISLAKREETLFGDMFKNGKKIDVKTDVGKLLIALRDYAHHFAIRYHKKRRHKELKR